MRFAAVKSTPQPQRMQPAREILRRLLETKPALGETAAPVRVEELPADLDQRVRLVGEW